VRFLAAGPVLLKVTHSNVAVEAGTVIDLEPADCYVAADLGAPTERELVARGD
jgi:hypothetical protein